MLLLTIRSVNGLPLSELNEEEQEIAAKAIQCGYLQKDGEFLKPAIVVLDNDSDQALWSIADGLVERTGELARNLAAELAEFMKKHIPPHLMSEYVYYNNCIVHESGTAVPHYRHGLLGQPGTQAEVQERYGKRGGEPAIWQQNWRSL